MTVRTRMAPSPTGEFHIGSMRTLLYNYAWARKNNGAFILRIEDTDKRREVAGSQDRILQVIKDYGFDWDEFYVQSERLAIYKDHIDVLLNTGHAYHCFCTEDRLAEMRAAQKEKGLAVTKYDRHCLGLSKEEVNTKLTKNEPYVIRLKIPSDQDFIWDDAVLGKVIVNSKEVDDQVLLKSDGYPTYHLAVVVDDYLMNITHVFRGVEWLPSTPKHIFLYQAFGWTPPVYGHLPNLKALGENKKLSKRFGDVSANAFLKDGYLPEALVNFLMFIGWNPGTEKELYTLKEFVADFDITKLHKTDLVVADWQKLMWLNGVYIRQLTSQQLLAKFENWAKTYDITLEIAKLDEAKKIKILDLIKERIKKLSEINELTHYFVHNPTLEENLLVTYTKSKEIAKELLQNFDAAYKTLSSWNVESLDKLSHQVLSDFGYKPKEAFMTVRIAVTGESSTPPLFDTLEALGKEAVLERIGNSLKILS